MVMQAPSAEPALKRWKEQQLSEHTRGANSQGPWASLARLMDVETEV